MTKLSPSEKKSIAIGILCIVLFPMAILIDWLGEIALGFGRWLSDRVKG